jgi:DNA-binding NarL/FixJ family response regulator
MKTLLVGRYFLIREALRGILRELKSDAVVMEAADSPEAMRLLSEEAGIGLVILDLDRNGLAALGALCGRHPEVSVVVVSSTQDHDTIVKALGLGAQGFILQSAERRVMISALELVFAGGIYIPPEVLAAQNSSGAKAGSPRDDAEGTAPRKVTELSLTRRQADVLALMMQGKPNKAICRQLGLAESTVKNHIGAIFRELGVSNRVEAVLAAGALGWKPPAGDRGVPRREVAPAKVVKLPRQALPPALPRRAG